MNLPEDDEQRRTPPTVVTRNGEVVTYNDESVTLGGQQITIDRNDPSKADVGRSIVTVPDGPTLKGHIRGTRQANGRRAYYIDEERFTPSQFRRLSQHRKIEAIVQWFSENYEDPGVRTPYETAEGGFQWIWGGPYDAHEQIGDQFSDLVDDSTIEQAVAEVTSDGIFDWAPKARPEDYREDEDLNEAGTDEDYNQLKLQEDYSRTTLTRRDPTPSGEAAVISATRSNFFPDSNFSNFAFVPDDSRTTTAILATDEGVSIADDKGNRLVVGEKANSVEVLGREMLESMDRLEALLRQNLNASPNRGHNRPPELLEVERPVTQEQFQEAFAAIEEVKRQSKSVPPDVLKVEAQVSVFKRLALCFAGGVLWVSGQGVGGVIGQEAGAAFTSHKQQIAEALIVAANTVSAWLQHLTSIL